jgi:hypothetical protein
MSTSADQPPGFLRVWQLTLACSWIRQNSADPDLKSGDFSYRGHKPLPHSFLPKGCVNTAGERE